LFYVQGNGDATFAGAVTVNNSSHSSIAINSPSDATASWTYYKQNGTLRWATGREGNSTNYQIANASWGVMMNMEQDGDATFAGSISSSNFSSGETITSDMNSLTKPGFYRIDNTDGINQPVNATHYSCIVAGKPPNVISQWAVHLTNGQTYTRCFNSSWSSWVRIDD
jgi:hypothetical protein